MPAQECHGHKVTLVESGTEPAELYGEAYYRCGCGPIPYEHSEHWIRFFSGIAEQIISSLKPQRVLDAGCAMGFLVEAFWDRGIGAQGIDISPYAISRVRRDIMPYCRVASLTEPIEERFDLITCIEVLEHMPAEAGRAAIRSLCQATDTILFSSSPRDVTEPTHFNVCPPITWLKLFADSGFWPDLQYDAGFLTPQAMLLRRDAQGYPPEVLTLFAQTIWYKLQADDQTREIAELNRQIAMHSGQDWGAWSREFDQLRALFHHIEIRLDQVSAETERTSRDVHSMLHSRIWQMLVKSGSMLLSLQRAPQRLLQRIRPPRPSGAG